MQPAERVLETSPVFHTLTNALSWQLVTILPFGKLVLIHMNLYDTIVVHFQMIPLRVRFRHVVKGGPSR